MPAVKMGDSIATALRLINGGYEMKPRTKKIGYELIVVWMFLPVMLSLSAGMVANAFGCRLNEGSIHPCLAFGMDIGGTLYFWGMMGWFSLATFPTGVFALVVFSLVVWWRSRTAAQI